MKAVFDGLELGSRCSQSFEESYTSKPEEPKPEVKPEAAGTFFVSPNGLDSNSGTSRSSPFKTIQRAVEATRSEAGPTKQIILLTGTFYLSDAVRLYAVDSGLQITSDAGATVSISGGKPLAISNWQPYKVDHTQSVKTYSGVNNVLNRVQPGANTTTIRFLGNFANATECQKACVTYN